MKKVDNLEESKIYEAANDGDVVTAMDYFRKEIPKVSLEPRGTSTIHVTVGTTKWVVRLTKSSVRLLGSPAWVDFSGAPLQTLLQVATIVIRGW